MVSLTRIYTRGGDQGETSLGDGSRRMKTDARLVAIGEVDEANCTLGLALVSLRVQNISGLLPIIQILSRCQNDLFDVGADLAVPGPRESLRVMNSQSTMLESAIDTLNQNLPPLDSFIMPGGGTGDFADGVARLHLARAVTRRAERAVINLNQSEKINPEIIRYLNRLSDFLFVAARAVAHQDLKGQAEVKWRPGGG
ncbi:MAG: cob(I)yrinic acid a,c-diamide adenosyltransferase [Alphaproteobacteria bacterium]|nr:cob(I)yrinic acid a,c-diamide adenosyltransferase [Alphaproteobacteria bacterium]